MAVVPTEPPSGSLTYRPGFELDLGFALMGIKTVVRRSGVQWWATTTPTGPATVAFRVAGSEVRADAWGPGTEWALDQFPALLGADDDPSDFRLDHPALANAASKFSSLRIGSTARWYEAAATAAIGQRVVKTDASASRAKLARRYGDQTLPGPIPTFPTPDTILGLSDQDFHRAGVERSRARVVRVAAKYADRMERLSDLRPAEATEWLQRLPGIGPWTAALTTAQAGGDADAVPVGDLHIPRNVVHTLAGEENGSDARMLELLEPYAGHRQRVVRLVKMAGGEPNHRPAPFRYDISRI